MYIESGDGELILTVTLQYNISGSRTPTQRHNDVDLQSHGACQGNASITTEVKGNEGGTQRVR